MHPPPDAKTPAHAENGSDARYSGRFDRNGARLIALFLLLLYVMLASFPGVPPVRPGNLDDGWVLGLNMAHAQRLVAGTDYIWTYGPLGFLRYADPAGDALPLALFFRFAMFFIWAAALARIVLADVSKIRAAWVLIVFAGAKLVIGDTPTDHLELAVLALALAALIDTRWRWLELAAAAVLSGLAAMVKLNAGAETFLLLLAVSVIVLRKRVVVLTAISAASALFFYVLATGHLLSIASYVRYSWEIASGYSISMGLPGPLLEVAVALVSILVLLVGIPALADDWRRIAVAMAPAAIWAFFAFKLAMVRQDAHATAFQADIALAALFPLMCAASARDRRMVGFFQAASLGLAVVVCLATWSWFPGAIESKLSLGWSKGCISGYLSWSRTLREIDAGDRAVRDSQRLGPEYRAMIGSASVDAMPSDIARVRANGWRWQPHGVLQSYSAYTPALDGFDAAHFASPHSADFLLVDWGSIDGRHPFLEEPRAWRTVLDWYDVRLPGSSPLLLGRRTQPRFADPRPIGSVQTRWDEAVKVPAHSGVLIAQVEIQKSLFGTVRNMLYRMQPVF
ncbi:MAG: hypothetical protein ABSG25_11805, partial [Bryobacteraceae bacterium]